MRASLLALLLATAVAGCGSTREDDDDTSVGDGDADGDADGQCSDQDGDGYGVGPGCVGDDCDDGDADVQACDCGPNGDAHETGCACDAMQPEACYGGSPGTAGIGACVSGLRSCRDGRWGECEGDVVDVAETCDGDDNNCDGEVDEGVLGPCGDCSAECTSLDWGPDGTPFEPDASNSSGIVGTGEGWLTLSQEAVSTHVIWIANSLDGTISKFDTRTREELARYRTGPLGTSSGLWSGNGDNPSRTSVNYYGDAYVANRAFTGQASATKILVDGCPDRGDGIVNTSSGGDDVLPWGVDGPEDDCIAWNTPVGVPSGLGRSIASQVRQQLDGSSHEYAWMGIHSEQTYYEIDGDTGELTGVEAVLNGCTPYGAAIDADGNLWSSCYSYAAIARFDTADPADFEIIQIPSEPFSYGMTVDAEGNVWNSSQGIDRYRPADQEWDHVDTGGTFTAGIAVDADGIAWANGDTGTVMRVDSNDPALPLTTIATGRGGRGVAIDSDAYIWIINWNYGVSDGDVTIIDPADPENFDTVCCDSINNSYTYSDMSGFQLRNATAPRGTYELIAEGCEAPNLTEWVGIDLDADLPAGTAVRADVRTAATLPELTAAAWIPAGSSPPDDPPFDLRAVLSAAGVEPEYYIGVRVTLESFTRDALPVVRGIGLQRSCSNPFG